MKINLGCGNHIIEGWLNLDKKGTWSRWEYGQYKDIIKEFDMTKFPWDFKDKSVNVITTSHVLNQIDKKFHTRIYEEVYRIVRKGGYFRITDDDNSDPNGKYYKEKHEHAVTYMNPTEIWNTLKEIGFSRVQLVGENETYCYDKAIMQNNHPELDTNSKFFIEAIK